MPGGCPGEPLLTCHGLVLVPLGVRASLCGSALRPILLPPSELQVPLTLLRVWYLPDLIAIPPVGWALCLILIATMSGPCHEGRWDRTA